MVITDGITQGKYSKGITQYCQKPLDGQHGNHLPLIDSVSGFYVNRGSQCLWNRFRWHKCGTKEVDEARKSPFYAVLSGWDPAFKSLLLRNKNTTHNGWYFLLRFSKDLNPSDGDRRGQNHRAPPGADTARGFWRSGQNLAKRKRARDFGHRKVGLRSK